jgi:glutamate racemase
MTAISTETTDDIFSIASDLEITMTMINELLEIAENGVPSSDAQTTTMLRATQRYVSDIAEISGRLYCVHYKNQSPQSHSANLKISPSVGIPVSEAQS